MPEKTQISNVDCHLKHKGEKKRSDPKQPQEKIKVKAVPIPPGKKHYYLLLMEKRLVAKLK